ncbi:uncharacterized protein VICG_00554 [Vittaforma corneae ATCC 50505]|uniref:Uncharacterized protein n=1 Tax=Vittaforma corneae (strain ATCC 50505) TaxID=993615 RepID=L2GPL8_VITCO|nr:uncharacterized protein VICG_00554 [Vittaforma corneae ATCC 50505]ELA42455.1 hypothetical protein VICG_00554 [Vittaforma corneae ATCC 50505]
MVRTIKEIHIKEIMKKEQIKEPKIHASYTFVRLLLLRISSIGLYLAAYKNIDCITCFIIELSKHPAFPLLIVYETKSFLDLKEPILKAFVLILLFSTTLVPIIKALLKEIDTNTIFFWFSLCQVIFCIDSVRTSILNKGKSKKKKFSHDKVIPLEESILIPLKTENNGVFGNMAALFGFFGTFSRIDDNTQVLILQAIGFVAYLFVPSFLEKRFVHLSCKKLILVLCSFLIIQYLADQQIFFIFLSITAIVFSFLSLSIELIDKR